MTMHEEMQAQRQELSEIREMLGRLLAGEMYREPTAGDVQRRKFAEPTAGELPPGMSAEGTTPEVELADNGYPEYVDGSTPDFLARMRLLEDKFDVLTDKLTALWNHVDEGNKSRDQRLAEKLVEFVKQVEQKFITSRQGQDFEVPPAAGEGT